MGDAPEAVRAVRPPDRDIHGQDSDLAGIACPHCGGSATEVTSLVGGAASEILYYCLDCRSCFNWLKWQHRLPPIP